MPYPGRGAACWLGDLHLPCIVLDIPNVLNSNVFFTKEGGKIIYLLLQPEICIQHPPGLC